LHDVGGGFGHACSTRAGGLGFGRSLSRRHE
jgi:hypothetical protein